MNIQEVLKLKNGPVVQNEITKKRYVVYDYFFRYGNHGAYPGADYSAFIYNAERNGSKGEKLLFRRGIRRAVGGCGAWFYARKACRLVRRKDVFVRYRRDIRRFRRGGSYRRAQRQIRYKFHDRGVLLSGQAVQI